MSATDGGDELFGALSGSVGIGQALIDGVPHGTQQRRARRRTIHALLDHATWLAHCRTTIASCKAGALNNGRTVGRRKESQRSGRLFLIREMMRNRT